MKKIVAALTVALLLAVMVFPSTALAAKGGNGKVKSTPPGQVKKEAPLEVDQAEKPGKADKAEKPQKGMDAEEAEDPDDVEADDPDPADEDPTTVEPKRTGIANALSRIERNLARAEAKVLAGTKKALPKGLVGVYEKFMAWLGMTPEEPEDGTSPDDSLTPDDGEPGDEEPGDGEPGDDEPGDEEPPADETPDDGVGGGEDVL